MKIAGGCYTEVCEVPAWSRLFGSGGRAAAVAALHTDRVELHTYVPANRASGLRSALDALGVQLVPSADSSDIAFAYFHPLSTPHIEPPPSSIVREPAIHVDGEAVLRFGFMEGEAIVTADRAVYDPQTATVPPYFHANGSSAKALAVVLNEAEVAAMAGTSDVVAAAHLVIERENADVVVVKAGAKGAYVFESNGALTRIPAYRSDRVFKIGTGDVFSATFASHWAVNGVPATEAAGLASRAVAVYAASGRLVRDDTADVASLRPVPSGTPGLIFLAAATNTLGQRWMREEARWCLRMLGAAVKLGAPDSESLSGCAAMLAIVDHPTVSVLKHIEIAKMMRLPVIALAESPTSRTIARLKEQDADVTHDFTSAIYRAVWASIR